MSINQQMGEHFVTTIVIGTFELHGYTPRVAKLDTDGHASPAYKALIADYQRAFRSFSKEVLEEGMARFKDGWTHNSWPKIGQLMPYMIEAERALRPRAEEKRAPALPTPPPMSREQRHRLHCKMQAWREMMVSGDISRGTLEEARARCDARAAELERKYPGGLPTAPVSARERQRAANIAEKEAAGG